MPPRRAEPTTAHGSPLGLVGSVLFHALVIAAAFLTFHRNFDTPQDSHVVPVDLVTIADQSNVAAQAPAPQPEKQDNPTPPQPEKLDIPVPPAPEPPEPDMQEVEPAPEPPMPQFDVAKEKPKPVEKPAPKKNAAQDFASLLNKLTAPDKSARPVRQGPRTIQAVGAGTAMTADIADALRSQIRRCWSLQIFPPNPADAIVDYDLRLTQDGRVASLELMTRGGNSFTQAAAEAASRAIYQCQPYRLPLDRYNVWQEINPLRFDPRQMMEQ